MTKMTARLFRLLMKGRKNISLFGCKCKKNSNFLVSFKNFSYLRSENNYKLKH